MPIQLTAPHYENPQVRIAVVGIDLRNSEVVLTAEYGDTDPGDSEADPPVAPFWVPSGDVAAETHTIKNWELETDGTVTLVEADDVYNALVGSARGLVTFENKDADPNYAKVTVNHPEHGDLEMWIELSYSGVKRQLYQWLIDEAIYIGVIV